MGFVIKLLRSSRPEKFYNKTCVHCRFFDADLHEFSWYFVIHMAQSLIDPSKDLDVKEATQNVFLFCCIHM